jgi:ribosomal 30S subunit maturation factor RimM
MVDIWAYRMDLVTLEEPTDAMPDVAGFEVVTSDGEKIGKVDEATNETGRSWIVVDTGFWIFGKKRMIPAGAVESVDPDKRQLRVALTKGDIKKAPDYDEVRKGEVSYRDQLNCYDNEHLTTAPADSR